MKKWYLLSMVGIDKPSIVAKLTAGLCKNGCNLGDSSMARLGKNFVIMLAAQFDGSQKALENIVAPLAKELDLSQHIIQIDEGTHFIEPDVRLNFFSEDRPGILEDITTVLMECGLNILSLESNLESSQSNNTYSIHIEGTVARGITPLYDALDHLSNTKKIQSQIIPINTQATLKTEY